MNRLKTYEGFFDFLRKNSEDDDTALIYIKRLKRVKGICPYDIEFTPNDSANGSVSMTKYKVLFDDTPIIIGKVSDSNPFTKRNSNILINKGFVKKNKRLFYGLEIECVGEKEKVFAKASVLEELYELVEKVYKNDMDARRRENIRVNINPAADYLDPDIN